MKYPKLYIAGDILHISLSQSKNDVISIIKNELVLGNKFGATLFKCEEVTKEIAIEKFGKQLKELRLLPLVEQEPSFDFPIYSNERGCYMCQTSSDFLIGINPKTKEVHCNYAKNIEKCKEYQIITKKEFFEACGEFIEKANLKEIFTILND